jgi:hypothetical protein
MVKPSKELPLIKSDMKISCSKTIWMCSYSGAKLQVSMLCELYSGAVNGQLLPLSLTLTLLSNLKSTLLQSNGPICP